MGGGNVAMDAARSALRLGAEQSVHRLPPRYGGSCPPRKEEIEHAEEEGIIFKTLTNPVEIHGDENGFIKAITCIQMELGEPDASGRRRPIEVPGSEFTLEMDTVIYLAPAPIPCCGPPHPALRPTGTAASSPVRRRRRYQPRGRLCRRRRGHRRSHRHQGHGRRQGCRQGHRPVHQSQSEGVKSPDLFSFDKNGEMNTALLDELLTQ